MSLNRFLTMLFPNKRKKLEQGKVLAAKYGVADLFLAAIDAGYSVEEALDECDISSEDLTL